MQKRDYIGLALFIILSIIEIYLLVNYSLFNNLKVTIKFPIIFFIGLVTYITISYLIDKFYKN